MTKDALSGGPAAQSFLSRWSAAPPRTRWSLLVILALQLPIAGIVVPGSGFSALVGQEGIYWALTLMVIAFVVLFEKRTLESIGLRKTNWRGIAWGIFAAIVTVAGMALIYLAIFPILGLGSTEDQLRSVQQTPLWFQVALVSRAAIFEEIFYRGFMIERLREITGSKWLAAGLSLAAFTYAHLSYWGWGHLLVAGFGGLVLTALYLWRRDLASNMIAHFLTDAIGFALA